MTPITDKEKIDELLTRRVEKIFPSKTVLEKILLSGKRLRLYQGFDPSTPNLHLGHLIGLLTLKGFQELGHEVIFLIGDFTGRVGDPTGKLKARKVLSENQVLKNAETYKKQARIILNFSGENPVKIMFNSTWSSRLSFADVLKIAGHLTVQQLIERDMFQKRIKTGQPIFLNEFIYPLMQGYDSVAMKVDLEIGGNDQLFNMLVGRSLCRTILNKEKFVLTTKLLIDSQGKKIGKTEGNVINISNHPSQLFGQIMGLPDKAIIPCLKLNTQVPLTKIKDVELALKRDNPMIYKKFLAVEVIKMLHDQKTALQAQNEFEKVHQARGIPSKPAVYNLEKPGQERLIDSLVKSTPSSCPTISEAKRLIRQGGIDVDGKRVNDPQFIVSSGQLIKIGKKVFLKIK
jgi:tyrosyl-tRNA synthetase